MNLEILNLRNLNQKFELFFPIIYEYEKKFFFIVKFVFMKT